MFISNLNKLRILLKKGFSSRDIVIAQSLTQSLRCYLHKSILNSIMQSLKAQALQRLNSFGEMLPDLEGLRFGQLFDEKLYARLTGQLFPFLQFNINDILKKAGPGPVILQKLIEMLSTDFKNLEDRFLSVKVQAIFQKNLEHALRLLDIFHDIAINMDPSQYQCSQVSRSRSQHFQKSGQRPVTVRTFYHKTPRSFSQFLEDLKNHDWSFNSQNSILQPLFNKQQIRNQPKISKLKPKQRPVKASQKARPINKKQKKANCLSDNFHKKPQPQKVDKLVYKTKKLTTNIQAQPPKKEVNNITKKCTKGTDNRRLSLKLEIISQPRPFMTKRICSKSGQSRGLGSSLSTANPRTSSGQQAHKKLIKRGVSMARQ